MTAPNNQILIFKLNETDGTKLSNLNVPTGPKYITETSTKIEASHSPEPLLQCCIQSCVNANNEYELPTTVFKSRSEFPGFDVPTESQQPRLRQCWINFIQNNVSFLYYK